MKLFSVFVIELLGCKYLQNVGLKKYLLGKIFLITCKANQKGALYEISRFWLTFGKNYHEQFRSEYISVRLDPKLYLMQWKAVAQDIHSLYFL